MTLTTDMEDGKTITHLEIEKISDDVLHKKAHDESVNLKAFQKEIKKHNKIKKKLK